MIGDALKFESSVTAVSFYLELLDNKFLILTRYLLAAGLESGDIILFKMELEGNSLAILEQHVLSRKNTHSMSVKSLEWRPKSGERILASCSEDCSVRIFKINI